MDNEFDMEVSAEGHIKLSSGIVTATLVAPSREVCEAPQVKNAPQFDHTYEWDNRTIRAYESKSSGVKKNACAFSISDSVADAGQAYFDGYLLH